MTCEAYDLCPLKKRVGTTRLEECDSLGQRCTWRLSETVTELSTLERIRGHLQDMFSLSKTGRQGTDGARISIFNLTTSKSMMVLGLMQ